MKGNRRRVNSTFTGAVILFVSVAALVSIAVLVYAQLDKRAGANSTVIAVGMLAVIIGVSLAATLIDYLRRKYTVDKAVKKILNATDRITAGDFSVRLDIAHAYNRYDEYDCIMENLNKMTAELSKTEVLHNDFVSNVSHELKTPLAIIQNYAMLMRSESLDNESRASYAKTLAEAAERLSALITNMLKLNKLENQEIKSEAEAETFRLDEQIAEAVLRFDDMIEQKGLQLDCDLQENVVITAARGYLEIVWNNLLSNAIKFTDGGGKIAVTLKKANGKAVVQVQDTGCGISAETGKHIFEKFYQGDTSHSKEGNGLGLALVKKVIDLIGGTIAVSSEQGKGSTFTVMLKAE